MQLSTLIAQLGGRAFSWAAKADPRAEIHSYEPLLNGRERLPGVVYVGDAADLPLSAPDGTSFLCAHAGGAAPALANCNLVYADGEAMPLLGDVARIFSVEQKLINDMHALMLCLENEDGLQQLVETAYQFLKSPIIIVDTSYKILCMNLATVEDRPDLEEQRRLGYMMDRNIEAMRRDGLYEKARENRYPSYSRHPETHHGWLTALVYVYGIEAAQIGIMERDHPFSHYDYELTHFLCKLVALELQKDEFYRRNFAMMHTVFLSDLLQSRVRDNRTAQSRVRQLGWTLTEHMYLFTVFEQNYGVFDRKAQLIGEQIQHLVPGSRWVIYENRIVFLLPLTPEKKALLSPDGALAQYLVNNKLTASVSEEFSELLSLRRYYTQCISAFELGQLQCEAALYRYTDHVFHHIGAIVAKQTPLYDFYHPGVLAVARYDAAHTTELLKTLHEYLRYGDDPARTANSLCIHKNTLFYRMNKLREQFGLNLSDGNERARVWLTLKFLELEKAGYSIAPA